MTNTQDRKKEEAPILHGNFKEVVTWQVKIPQCCIENWPDCPHVARRLRAKKGNIGL